MPVPILPAAHPALPDNLCFKDRGQGQIDIMPVMQSRAEKWIDDLYLGDAFKPVITVKQRRAALINSKQKIHQLQLEQSTSTRKRKRKAKDVDIELQDAIYWAPVDPECAATTGAFINIKLTFKAMAVDSRKRSREEERIIDTYWSQGMSLDPVLKTETIDETHKYLKHGQKAWKVKDYLDRGIENGDLAGIDDGSDALTARATKYQKIAPTMSADTSATQATKRH